MAHDASEQSLTIAAPPEEIIAALLDFESYPTWQRIMRDVRVLDRDADGRGTLVEFTVDAKVRTVRYVSRYRYDLPHGFSWELAEGDLTRNDGRYTLRPNPSGGTDVAVSIEFDPGFWVPGPVRSAVAGQSLRMTLRELRTRLDG